MDKGQIREMVREKYAKVITEKSGCCGSSSCCGQTVTEAAKTVTGNLYSPEEVGGLPKELLETSLGCGNPSALASLHAGEVVLDLGSGAGLDVLLSARRVGEHGKAYGLDMTDEMLAEANANKAKAGIENVEFLKGHIEEIPLPDNSVDVVISNCVINLSADKDQVLRDIFRVLRPGGRMAVSDIVLTRPLPEKIRQGLLAWAGCVAGALLEHEYRDKLSAAGFTDIGIEVTRIYDLSSSHAASLLPEANSEELANINGGVVSAFVRAKKPPQIWTSGTEYVVEHAGGADFPRIHQLLVQAGLTTEGVNPESGSYLVARKGEVVGVIGLEMFDGSAMIRSFAVIPSARKSGIGRTLVLQAIANAKKQGATTAYLLTNTASEYAAMFGFETIARAEIPPSVLTSSALGSACPVTSSSMRLVIG